ncbi:MAG: 3-deoxy-D-manno-octulosonic acid transferase [Blastocatellia bacterium]|nr:3-deoxy-D-manno-octulosonic acid transferase [Blastocatellia bacterium]
MYLLYSVLLLSALVATAPYFLYQIFLHKKYFGSLKQRFAFSLPKLRPSTKRLLLHTVSVGEFLAAQPLIEKLRSLLPDYQLVITTTTAAGQKLAQNRAADYADICYFPLDFGFSTGCFLDHIKPKVVVILETEIWPNFLAQAAKRDIPVVIANGRISDRSFGRYKAIKFILEKVLSNITLFLMQSSRDVERIVALGSEASKVFHFGNIKYDIGSDQMERLDTVAAELDKLLGLKNSSKIIVAGSTVSGEEGIFLSAYKQLIVQPGLEDTRLILAPRHPERFEAVAKLLLSLKIDFVRRSAMKLGDKVEKVVLLDSIGELAAIYRFADIVFVGGSLIPHGGHNILEPALYGRAIITGSHTSNFHKIVEDFLAAEALIQLPVTNSEKECEQSLAAELIRMMEDEKLCTELGSRALEVIKANRGAVDRHIDKIASLLKQKEVMKN